MLTNKQKAFVEIYLSCWNATEAARLAGYSEKTARSIGSENLTKPDILTEIERRLSELTLRSNEVLARLSMLARGSIEHFLKINNDGSAHLNLRGSKDYLYLIKKIKTRSSRRVEGRGKYRGVWEDEISDIELHDVQKALELLGRRIRLFDSELPQRHEIVLTGVNELLNKVYWSKGQDNSEKK